MSDWRKLWLLFKKDHPNFEQNKIFKADVGPQMADFEDALEKYCDTIAAVVKARESMDKLRDNLQAAVAGYRRILSTDDMKKDKTAETDFDGTLENRQRSSVSQEGPASACLATGTLLQVVAIRASLSHAGLALLPAITRRSAI
jgi:hypothetical protein